MTLVKTIRQPSSLVLAMKTSGGIYARDALLQAAETIRGARAENLVGQAELLAQMQAWKSQGLYADANWQDLYEYSSGLISICDPDVDTHVVRCARMLCEYVGRTSGADRRKAVGELFISTLITLSDRAANAEVRDEVLNALEALVPQLEPGRDVLL